METKIVHIDKDIYELTAVTADVSAPISLELLTDFTPLLVSIFDGNTELLNKEIRTSFDKDKLMRIFIELINPMILKKNNNLINDWKEEFARKPLTLFRLGYEALRFNCEDFFTFMSGFAKEKLNGINLPELIKSLEKEGVEMPLIVSLLTQSSEQETEPVEEQ